MEGFGPAKGTCLGKRHYVIVVTKTHKRIKSDFNMRDVIIRSFSFRFVGIVIDRGGCGLRSWCVVRNVIDGFGVEICYELYRSLNIDLAVISQIS